MEKIEVLLEELIQEQLEDCKTNKKVPSKEVLDTIETLFTINRL